MPQPCVHKFAYDFSCRVKCVCFVKVTQRNSDFSVTLLKRIYPLFHLRDYYNRHHRRNDSKKCKDPKNN